MLKKLIRIIFNIPISIISNNIFCMIGGFIFPLQVLCLRKKNLFILNFNLFIMI